MGAQEMEQLRRNLVIPPTAKVRVLFEPPEEGDDSELIARLECLSCDDLLLWDASRLWWVCPQCGYEVTSAEILLLAGKVKAGLKVLVTDVEPKRGSGRSWLARLFGISCR